MSLVRRSRRTVLRHGLAVFAAVSTAGCLSGQSATTQTVAMTDTLGFDPEIVTIPSGGTVKWVNEGDVAHTVTASEDELPDGADYFASGGFDTERAARNNMTDGIIPAGETYEHTFEQPGTYGYYCIPHEGSGMVGTVRVK